jgi:adenylate cyclase
VIKTIDEEAMIVGSDPAALTDWAVRFQELSTDGARPRIEIHCGEALLKGFSESAEVFLARQAEE